MEISQEDYERKIKEAYMQGWHDAVESLQAARDEVEKRIKAPVKKQVYNDVIHPSDDGHNIERR
jgi:hypothetical protein